MNSPIRVIAVVLFLALGAVGYYAWQLRAKFAGSVESNQGLLADSNTKLGDCAKARDLEKGAREDAEKLATANLNASRTELDDLRKERQDADKRLEAFKALTEKFRKMIDSGKLQVIVRHGRMVVKLPAGILFASGSAELSKDGKTAIADVAGILKQFPDRRFEVAGHTDNVPLGPSTFKNNLELSAARAVTVTGQLISTGMNPSKLSAAGYSQYAPARENSNEAGRQENRRIEIVLLPNLAELPPLPAEMVDGGAPNHAK
ncbi:MAG: OmpA family protein [Polyangiaceae bacterium]